MKTKHIFRIVTFVVIYTIAFQQIWPLLHWRGQGLMIDFTVCAALYAATLKPVEKKGVKA
ncbi:MAG: hypothetical protein ACK5MW_04950 [Enterococcus sp.]